MESADTDAAPNFPYDVSTVSNFFATSSFVQGSQVGEYVAFVLRVLAVEIKATSNTAEPYLILNGVDMEGTPVGPLRLWRFNEDDVVQGNTCIIRGLKVVPENRRDDEKWKWVPSANGVNTIECTVRTALEDVTGVDNIMTYFNWQ